jgi:hypothetical protein
VRYKAQRPAWRIYDGVASLGLAAGLPFADGDISA